ncbi:putative leader peptide [Streptomyces humi]|nr:putative leader peptide [Streptomyces humi]
MDRLRVVTGTERRECRTPWPASLLTSPLLTSRRHIDLLRVCSAISRTG